MATRLKYNWEALKPQIEKRIAQGDGVQSLAWRYGVNVAAIVRMLKRLGLETFEQRYQRLTAKKKRKHV